MTDRLPRSRAGTSTALGNRSRRLSMFGFLHAESGGSLAAAGTRRDHSLILRVSDVLGCGVPYGSFLD